MIIQLMGEDNSGNAPDLDDVETWASRYDVTFPVLADPNWGIGTLVTWTVLLAIAVGMVGQFVPRRVGDALEYRVSKLPPMVMAVGIGVWLVVINLLGPQGVAPFIYFQF